MKHQDRREFSRGEKHRRKTAQFAIKYKKMNEFLYFGTSDSGDGAVVIVSSEYLITLSPSAAR